jgi:hypothetical protein
MPEIKKEAESCHNCGLESLGDCEERSVHRPVDEKSPPCKFCARNPDKAKTAVIADFYSENWVLSFGLDKKHEEHWSPIIEDPDAAEQKLLKFLHAFQTVYEAI